MRLRVPVDFNQVDEEGAVPINTIRYSNFLELLKPGLDLTLYDHDGLEFDGIAKFDEQLERWFGILDFSTRRDVEL